jgi:hypothetical protein
MQILNKYLLGAGGILLMLGSVTATARDNVYFNFGYSNGYPAQRQHYYAPPVVVAPAYGHYYAPAPVYYYGERCPPPRRHHSLNRHRYREHWNQGYGYHDRGYPASYGYAPRSRVFVEIDD